MISVFFQSSVFQISSMEVYEDLNATTFTNANITLIVPNEGPTSSSSLALQAFLMVLTISVPVTLMFVVIFCSPSSKRRLILNALANNKQANQNGASNRIGVQNNTNNNDQTKTTTVDMVTMVNERETVVLSNCKISTY